GSPALSSRPAAPGSTTIGGASRKRSFRCSTNPCSLFLQNPAKLVREADLAVVLGGVADHLLGAGDAPEAVAVAADAVEDLERGGGGGAVAGGVDRLDEGLRWVADAEGGAERPAQLLGIGSPLGEVDARLARPADPDLDVLQPLPVALDAGREDEAQVLVGLL